MAFGALPPLTLANRLFTRYLSAKRRGLPKRPRWYITSGNSATGNWTGVRMASRSTWEISAAGPAHWASLRGIDFQCLGIDWRLDLVDGLRTLTDRWALQGNIDPNWLLLSPSELEVRLRGLFARVLVLPPAQRAAWICGLGHGVLQQTPEENIRLAIKIQREMFA